MLLYHKFMNKKKLTKGLELFLEMCICINFWLIKASAIINPYYLKGPVKWLMILITLYSDNEGVSEMKPISFFVLS